MPILHAEHDPRQSPLPDSAPAVRVQCTEPESEKESALNGWKMIPRLLICIFNFRWVGLLFLYNYCFSS